MNFFTAQRTQCGWRYKKNAGSFCQQGDYRQNCSFTLQNITILCPWLIPPLLRDWQGKIKMVL